MRAREWIPENVVIPEETESPGPFDLNLFPHVAEVLEEVDNPMVREIYLQWASRVAKTTTILSVLIYYGVNAPRPAMFGSCNEARADDTIDAQLYPMLEACAATAPQLLPQHMRNRRFVRLERCRIRRTFSGSPATMAGFPACYGAASEVGKWNRKKSGEGNPVKLFLKRGANYPFESKYLFEGTPAELGRCEMTSLMQGVGVDRRRRYVPCPHCGEFQILRMGDRDSKGGLKWPRGDDGHSDVLQAAVHAYYECEKCLGRIENYHRPEMLRAGRWLSEGQTIDKRGGIHGARRFAGSKVGFGPLSSLYSLLIGGWGTIASEWLSCGSDPGRRQEFWNQTLAEEYHDKPPPTKPHELVERLVDRQQPAAIVPAWGKFVTVGVDVQSHGQTFPWVACAWGDGGRGAEIEHGIASNFDSLKKDVLETTWPHADGGPRLAPAFRLMDSGDQTELCYSLCRQVRNMLPAKGMSHAFNLEYEDKRLSAAQRRSRNAVGEVRLIEVNTAWTQRWIQRLIDGLRGATEPLFMLSAGCELDVGFLDELLNEQEVREFSDDGYEQSSWQRINRGQPNDYRDAIRLAKVAASLVTSNGKLWDRLPPRVAPAPDAIMPRDISGFTTPDGRPYLITER